MGTFLDIQRGSAIKTDAQFLANFPVKNVPPASKRLPQQDYSRYYKLRFLACSTGVCVGRVRLHHQPHSSSRLCPAADAALQQQGLHR